MQNPRTNPITEFYIEDIEYETNPPERDLVDWEKHIDELQHELDGREIKIERLEHELYKHECIIDTKERQIAILTHRLTQLAYMPTPISPRLQVFTAAWLEECAELPSAFKIDKSLLAMTKSMTKSMTDARFYGHSVVLHKIVQDAHTQKNIKMREMIDMDFAQAESRVVAQIYDNAVLAQEKHTVKGDKSVVIGHYDSLCPIRFIENPVKDSVLWTLESCGEVVAHGTRPQGDAVKDTNEYVAQFQVSYGQGEDEEWRWEDITEGRLKKMLLDKEGYESVSIYPNGKRVEHGFAELKQKNIDDWKDFAIIILNQFYMVKTKYASYRCIRRLK